MCVCVLLNISTEYRLTRERSGLCAGTATDLTRGYCSSGHCAATDLTRGQFVLLHKFARRSFGYCSSGHCTDLLVALAGTAVRVTAQINFRI